ncbi:MAG: NAD(P)-dependent alcohol dehydrogenase [Vicinamibacteria bacterium]
MKAIIYRKFGPPHNLQYQDVEKPTPGDDQALIRVRAAALNPLDWRLMSGGPPVVRFLLNLGKPRIKRPGVDFAGEVEAVGPNVTQLKPGDAVFGGCKGAFAEYVCASESRAVLKPENMTFEQASSVPVAGLTALQGLRDKGRIQPGQKILINGASGGVGTFAVQIAKSFGAEVTGVCSTGNLEMVRSIGANRVIDYSREDFTRGAQRYDLILDNVGNRSPSECRRVLAPNGICVIAGAPKKVLPILGLMLKAAVFSRLVSQKFPTFVASFNRADLTFLHDLMKAGKVRPVIDRQYPLRDAAEAMAYAEQGHSRGKVVLTV